MPVPIPAIRKRHLPEYWIAASVVLTTIFGEEVWKPYIGDNERPLTTEDMRIAVRINRSVEWIMVIIVVATATCMYVIPSFF